MDFSDGDGENIKVCVRVRPMNMTEAGRGDSKCIEYLNASNLKFKNKTSARNYTYNLVFSEDSSQENLFYSLSLDVKIYFT